MKAIYPNHSEAGGECGETFYPLQECLIKEGVLAINIDQSNLASIQANATYLTLNQNAQENGVEFSLNRLSESK